MSDRPVEVPELPTPRDIDRLGALLEPLSRVAILLGVQFLRGQRDADPRRGLLARLLRRSGQSGAAQSRATSDHASPAPG